MAAEVGEKNIGSIFAREGGAVIDSSGIGGDIFGQDGSFAATGSADYAEIAPVLALQEIRESREDVGAICKVCALFSKEAIDLAWDCRYY